MRTHVSKKDYAVCIDNTEYEVSLERGKIYQVLPDPIGADHGYLRVIDESGEDYLFDSDRFFPITISQKLKKALNSPPANKSIYTVSAISHGCKGPSNSTSQCLHFSAKLYLESRQRERGPSQHVVHLCRQKFFLLYCFALGKPASGTPLLGAYGAAGELLCECQADKKPPPKTPHPISVSFLVLKLRQTLKDARP